jgi:hypothetical protein
MRDVFRVVVFIIVTVVGSPLVGAQTGTGDAGEMLGRIEDLRRQVAGLQATLRQREEWFDAVKKDIGAVGEEIAALRERVASPVAQPFLSGPPPSTDAVGVSKVAVFAPRIVVDSSRQHDSVFLKVRRVEVGAIRAVADVELGSDQMQIDLPLDQNGALYIVDWQTSEGQTYSLLLRDGSGGTDSSAQPAATVQVKPLQNQGRFLFVGYRVE